MIHYYIAAFLGALATIFSAFYMKKAPKSPPDESFINNDPAPVLPPQTPPVAVQKPMLGIFSLAIRDFEGAPGDANYKNNNPGNCRFNPAGYLKKYGNVKESPAGFAIFPTYELGWEYLEALVTQMVKNHPNWTITDFFMNYAPPSDNNPTNAYAAFVAKRCSVSTGTLLKDLFPDIV